MDHDIREIMLRLRRNHTMITFLLVPKIGGSLIDVNQHFTRVLLLQRSTGWFGMICGLPRNEIRSGGFDAFTDAFVLTSPPSPSSLDLVQ